jgi:hypothetical protein
MYVFCIGVQLKVLPHRGAWQNMEHSHVFVQHVFVRALSFWQTPS